MAVKVRAGLRGLDAGLDAVRIGGLSMLLDGGSGTLLGRQGSRICSQTLLETAV
jgi:hypothetical protein